jgi:hypothetical protein
MDNANFILTEDNVPVFQTFDIASEEVTRLNTGDEILCDEKFKKNKIEWISVFLSDDRKGFIMADTKGIKISLMVLKQPSADVFETPDASSKIIFTYHEGDKLQVIGSVKKDELLWVKTESLSGIVGFMPGSIKGKEEPIATPSEKWPIRIGAAMGLLFALIEFYLYIISNNHSGGSLFVWDLTFAFGIGALVGYLPTFFYIKLKRQIFR